jgi:hypothetical protein
LLLLEVDFVDTFGTVEVSVVAGDMIEIIDPIACDGD